MDREQVIRFQVMVYCYMNGLFSGKTRVSHTDIDCLTLIGIRGTSPLKELCEELVHYGVCGSTGYARGCVTRLQDMKLVCKESVVGSAKAVYLNPAMAILEPQTDVYLMNINYEQYGTQESN